MTRRNWLPLIIALLPLVSSAALAQLAFHLRLQEPTPRPAETFKFDSDDLLIVGSARAVHFYKRVDGVWREQQKIVPSAADVTGENFCLPRP